MTTLKTRQQKRAEKRRARKARNLFQTGLEALEVPDSGFGASFHNDRVTVISSDASEF